LALADHRQRLDEAANRQKESLERLLRILSERLLRAQEKLGALRPEAVLARGYSITRLSDRTVVRSARQVTEGARAEVIFAEGFARVMVERSVLPDDRS
jgi:exodeoxyribonuclease VII large subunit